MNRTRKETDHLLANSRDFDDHDVAASPYRRLLLSRAGGFFILLSATAFAILTLRVLHVQSSTLSEPNSKGSVRSNVPLVGDSLQHLFYPPIPATDFGPYKEFSVAHSDRSLDYTSPVFQKVMRDLNSLLKYTYNAHQVAIIPGSGTFGMESVARTFATSKTVLVLSNGHFGYRWVNILEMGSIPAVFKVLYAIPTAVNHRGDKVQLEPHPLDEVLDAIHESRPDVVFCTHVETSTGLILPDEYIQALAQAIHDYDGLLVVDAIASGAVYLDMQEMQIDVLIASPQKDWTSPPGAALVMLSKRAVTIMETSHETSLSLSLKQWCRVMTAYEQGGFAYHTTPPTDMLRQFQQVSVEILRFGIQSSKQAQMDLGKGARAFFQERGLESVAAPGFQSPGVLVYYTPDGVSSTDIATKFQNHGIQIAHGLSWNLFDHEPESFRVGLFGLDKLMHMNETLKILDTALDEVLVDMR